MKETLVNIFHQLPIRKKLAFFFALSVILSIGITTVSSILYSSYDEKKTLINTITHLSSFSAKNLAASILFFDIDSMQSILTPALADKNIKRIAVCDVAMTVLTFVGNEHHIIPDELKARVKTTGQSEINMNLDELEILSPIAHHDELIGYIDFVVSTQSIKNKLYNQIIAFSMIFVVTNILMLFITVRFERILLSPLFNLIDTIKKIKSSQRFDIKVVSSSTDEFNYLITEFNKMIEAIRIRDNALKEHNITLKEQVTLTTTELEIVKKDLEKATYDATRDALTGLCNRRSTMERFETMLHRAKKRHSPIGIVALDIDFFKNVNDTLGHHSGDMVLKAVARILEKNKRKDDVVGRIGGEEFLLICNESNMDITLSVAERIRCNVEQAQIVYEEGKSTHVTISLGVFSTVPDDASSADDLFKIADKALYKAKHEGRNRVSIGRS